MTANLVSPTMVGVASSAQVAAIGLTGTVPTQKTPPLNMASSKAGNDWERMLRSKSEIHHFRQRLRIKDKTIGAVKEVMGLWERSLDFVLLIKPLTEGQQVSEKETRDLLRRIQLRFVTYLQKEWVHVFEPHLVHGLMTHLEDLHRSKEVDADTNTVWPIYKEVVRRLKRLYATEPYR